MLDKHKNVIIPIAIILPILTLAVSWGAFGVRVSHLEAQVLEAEMERNDAQRERDEIARRLAVTSTIVGIIAEDVKDIKRGFGLPLGEPIPQ